MTYNITAGPAYYFTIGSISSSFSDLYIPRGYVCNWKVTTDPKNKY